MTPEQIIDLLNQLEILGQRLKDSAQEYYQLVLKANSAAVKTELELPLSQEETDHIIQVYSPLYDVIRTKIEVVTDEIGTDPFH